MSQLAIEKTEAILHYVRCLFRNCLHDMEGEAEISKDWSLELVQDCNYIVHLVLRALKNQSGLKVLNCEFKSLTAVQRGLHGR